MAAHQDQRGGESSTPCCELMEAFARRRTRQQQYDDINAMVAIFGAGNVRQK
jgi:hypothetical protein